MTNAQLMKKVARLESMNDQLATEISQIDQLMRIVGFSEGLATIKVAAQELIENGEPENDEEF